MADPPRPPKIERPWQVVEHPESFEVTDKNGLRLAYVYFDDTDELRRSIMRRLVKEQAERLAQEIARLPELLRIEKGRDPYGD